MLNILSPRCSRNRINKGAVILLSIASLSTPANADTLDKLRDIRFSFIKANMELCLTPNLEKCQCYNDIMKLERKNVDLLDKLDEVIISLGGSKELTVEETNQLDAVQGWSK